MSTNSRNAMLYPSWLVIESFDDYLQHITYEMTHVDDNRIIGLGEGNFALGKR